VPPAEKSIKYAEWPEIICPLIKCARMGNRGYWLSETATPRKCHDDLALLYPIGHIPQTTRALGVFGIAGTQSCFYLVSNDRGNSWRGILACIFHDASCRVIKTITNGRILRPLFLPNRYRKLIFPDMATINGKVNHFAFFILAKIKRTRGDIILIIWFYKTWNCDLRHFLRANAFDTGLKACRAFMNFSFISWIHCLFISHHGNKFRYFWGKRLLKKSPNKLHWTENLSNSSK